MLHVLCTWIRHFTLICSTPDELNGYWPRMGKYQVSCAVDLWPTHSSIIWPNCYGKEMGTSAYTEKCHHPINFFFFFFFFTSSCQLWLDNLPGYCCHQGISGTCFKNEWTTSLLMLYCTEYIAEAMSVVMGKNHMCILANCCVCLSMTT